MKIDRYAGVIEDGFELPPQTTAKGVTVPAEVFVQVRTRFCYDRPGVSFHLYGKTSYQEDLTHDQFDALVEWLLRVRRAMRRRMTPKAGAA